MEILVNRFVYTKWFQFLNKEVWKIRPKSPEVTLRRSAKKKTRSGGSASGFVDKQKPRVGIVSEQRLDVNGHQLLISEHVFSSFTAYIICRTRGYAASA